MKLSLVPVLPAVLAAAIAGCKGPDPVAQSGSAAAPPPTPVTADTSEQPARSTDVPTLDEPVPANTPAKAVSPSAFVDRVWKVESSSAVEPGTLYAFLSDGTLVIDAPNGTPTHGRWSFENGALTMIEEGIPYPVDILALDDGRMRLRSHNPGEPVDLTLVPAPSEPLPKAPAKP